MSHRHHYQPKRRKVVAWTGCVVRGWHDNQEAHGGVTFLDRCACGAARASEHNMGQRAYGPWIEAVIEIEYVG